jgi:hypothetical protein
MTSPIDSLNPDFVWLAAENSRLFITAQKLFDFSIFAISDGILGKKKSPEHFFTNDTPQAPPWAKALHLSHHA